MLADFHKRPEQQLDGNDEGRRNIVWERNYLSNFLFCRTMLLILVAIRYWWDFVEPAVVDRPDVNCFERRI